jgi:hypothetical protein
VLPIFNGQRVAGVEKQGLRNGRRKNSGKKGRKTGRKIAEIDKVAATNKQICTTWMGFWQSERF